MTSPDTTTVQARAAEPPSIDPSAERTRLLQQLRDLQRGAAGRAAALRGIPGIGTWLGLAVTLAGAIVLVIGWSRTADLGAVALQMPYVISAGGIGLGLIATGLAIVAIAAKVADAAARREQIGQLQETMAAIRAALEVER